uniref:Uncharacterized protein n=1 Tax=Amphimedon queenslandica TaxID=400682 RepID=A0A1X7U5B5_AMPQE
MARRGKMSNFEAEPQPVVCGQLQYTYNEPQSGFNTGLSHATNTPFDEIDFLSRLLTGPQAKEIVIYGESNPLFDIALATVRNNSWEGISYGVRHVFKFEEKKLQSIEQCSQMGRQQCLSELEIMKKIQDTLKTPAPPSMVKGKVVWYQYPQTNVPKIEEVINEMDDKQESGDYLLFGVFSGSNIDYGLTVEKFSLGAQRSTNIVNTFPNYYFLGVDRKFINKLISYGYNSHRYSGSIPCSNSEHQTFVFKKK